MYSLQVFQLPTESPRIFASAKSQIIGIAGLPKVFITFSLDGDHRHRELLKSTHLSRAKAKKVTTVSAYPEASDSPKAARASLRIVSRDSLIRSLKTVRA